MTTSATTDETKTEPTKITEADREAARERLREYVKQNGGDPAVLRAVQPLAIRATLSEDACLDDERILFSPVVELTPCVNPIVDDHLIGVARMDRLSDRSYRIGLGENTHFSQIMAIFELIVPATLSGSDRTLRRVHREGASSVNQQTEILALHDLIRNSKIGEQISFGNLQRAVISGGNRKTVAETCSISHFSSNGGQLFLKFCSAGPDIDQIDRGRGKLFLFEGAPDLNLLRPDDAADPARFSLAEAIAALKVAKEIGFPLIVDPQLIELKARLADRIVGLRVPGSPGLARLLVPAKLLGTMPSGVADELRPLARAEAAQQAAYHALTDTAERVSVIAEKLAADGVGLSVDERIADVLAMAAAKPTGKRDPLRPYQDECVSLHKATSYGFVDACSPGLGKTVITLQAMRERAAERKDGYRGLIVVPAHIRSQWAGEVEVFFPEAEVLVYQGKQLAQLDADLDAAANKPVVVIVSFDTMREEIDRLLAYRWHDLVGDELHRVLPNTSSKRTKALWQLRRNADVAVALTGTPINKSLDDVGRLLAWARDEEDAFHGMKLSKRFDMTEPGDVEEFWRHIGPCVFRRDRSEIADQLPKINTEVIRLDLEPAELRLAEGARRGLKKLYESLAQKLAVIEELRPDDPKVAQAREELRQVRGAVLGGITLARQAACDPVAVRESDSAGVALLDSAGLVEPAVRTGGTKRKLICELTEELVGDGEAVLIFTSFSSVAENLAADLEAQGVRVGTFTGKNSGKRREDNAAAFQSGDLDALILTGSGREGLNLQRAGVVILYDLDWEPSSVVQKIARAARFGSKAEQLQVLVPIAAGTIEERVAAVLLPRAANAIAALDTARGVKAEDTEMGAAFKGLAEAVSEDEKGDVSKFDLAAQILGD